MLRATGQIVSVNISGKWCTNFAESSWPSRKETIGSTAVVLVLVLLASLFLGAVDLALSRLVRLVVG